MTPLSAEDLDYQLVGRGILDKYLTVDKGIFDGGMQLLYGLQSRKM
jgi:hypothetical protein